MKKITLKLLVGVFLLLCSTLFVSCDKNNIEKEIVPSEATLQKIVIKTTPTKVIYTLNETLNIEGLVVVGSYTGGEEKIIKIDASQVEGFTSDKPTEKLLLTVTVNGKKAAFEVKVLPIKVTDGILTKVLPGQTSITLPNGVTEIAEGVFYNNQTIVNVVLNEGLKKIGPSAFIFSSLETINFPSTLQTMGKDAFNQCTKLKSVDLSATQLVTIPASAFFLNSSMISLKLPTTLTTIESQAFIDTYSLSEVVLPEGVMSLGNEAFRECGAKTVKLPNSLCYFDQRAFFLCSRLTTVTTYGAAPTKRPTDKESKMEHGCFGRCEALTSFSFPLGVEVIGQGVIGGSKVNTLTLHSGIKKLDFGTFDWLTNLQTVIVESATPPVADVSFGAWQGLSTSVQHIYVPSTAVDTYKNTAGWKEFASKISAKI